VAQGRSVGSVLREAALLQFSPLVSVEVRKRLYGALKLEVLALVERRIWGPDSVASLVRVSKEIAGTELLTSDEKEVVQEQLRSYVDALSRSSIPLEAEIAEREAKRVAKTSQKS